jgi:hypothetical protein
LPTRKDIKCRRCPTLVYRDSVTGLCADCLNKDRAARTPDAMLSAERQQLALREELSTTKKKLSASEADVKRLRRELHLTNEVAGLEISPAVIAPHHGTGTSEGTIVAVASDWHVEERVDPAKIGFVNSYTLDDAKRRAESFFKSTLRLTRLLQQDIKIENIVLALLGDFITNDIHEDMPELCQLPPTLAVEFAQNLLVSGIEFLLANSDVKLTIPCHSGNHARTTRTTRFAQENGHSLEYLMYRSIAGHFAARGEKRVEFRIADGYHSYVDVYGKTIRFHHGHAINYQGGIGGIFIPAFKAISQWDKMRQVDLDVFGHFHQMKDGSKFLSNGSLIGFNSFALSIKADYESPRQTLFLMDKKRGRTCTWPILVETKEQ